MAAVLFDIVLMKGEKDKMLSYLKIRDYELYSDLGLSSDLPAMTGEFRISYWEYSFEPVDNTYPIRALSV